MESRPGHPKESAELEKFRQTVEEAVDNILNLVSQFDELGFTAPIAFDQEMLALGEEGIDYDSLPPAQQALIQEVIFDKLGHPQLGEPVSTYTLNSKGGTPIPKTDGTPQTSAPAPGEIKVVVYQGMITMDMGEGEEPYTQVTYLHQLTYPDGQERYAIGPNTVDFLP